MATPGPLHPHHPVWFWIGTALLLVGIAVGSVYGTRTQHVSWTAGAMVFAYIVGGLAFVCIWAAVRGWPFPFARYLPAHSATEEHHLVRNRLQGARSRLVHFYGSTVGTRIGRSKAQPEEARRPGPAVRAVLTVHQPPHQYPPDPPMTEAQREIVRASRYAWKSLRCTVNIKRDESRACFGLLFKNIGPTPMRWEFQEFRVSVNDEPEGPVALYLSRRGTLAQGCLLYTSRCV